ncbi:hypothetical protein HPB48_007995 [Haemaphysalis longicornis]|uniref:Zinc finger C3HC4 RING-type domain-containing protein n=1 Tax=Haemaphysalis longicornis TaxID=44386 RepID=A0A9J6GV07_HAELO|nr:hypothetical protein HPB48_007995 [Haemaphysalis longicornis]
MASPVHKYTLVGFSEEVDRMPLLFLEALPATKVCSACGLVPKVVGLLPCEHFFCKPCYQQCLCHEEVVCPVEGEACLLDEVSWIHHSTRSVLTKKVW